MKLALRRAFLTIFILCFLSYVSYFFGRIYLDFPEPYPFPILPGFGSSSAYQKKIHRSQIYVVMNQHKKDSIKLKSIFRDIPGNAWSFVLSNNLIGRNPKTKQWMKNEFQLQDFDSAYYLVDSCYLVQNQIECHKKDTVVLFE